MAVLLILGWLVVFVPLAALPLLPTVDGQQAPASERPALREWPSLAQERQERAA